MSFNSSYEEIAKRGEYNGLLGLRYSKKKEHTQFIPPQPFMSKPVFNPDHVRATMSEGDRQTFSQDVLERQRFLEQTRDSLAGKRAVKEYEGTREKDEGLVFNPLKGLTGEYGGSYAYDSGAHQGGHGLDDFLGKSVTTRDESRGTTLSHPDPYEHRVSDKISIRTD